MNLELIKKPPQCLEYVIVHELAHFFERNHTEQFVALLDRMLPHWRIVRDELNAEALAHEDWST
ncbi:M48 family metallopeptidase [Paracoccus sp. DMF]|uniref:M48 metallopeptidase family protein n=1 Tax=Paracoccus sp. DMF TaxID=400837 RepID=UPI00398D27AC